MLDRITNLAAHANPNAVLSFPDDHTGITLRSGRVARWIAQFRSEENRAATQMFLRAIVDRYGKEIGARVASDFHLARAVARGKPLRARQVSDIKGRAEMEQGIAEMRNHTQANKYLTSPSAGVNPVVQFEQYRAEIRAIARESCPGAPNALNVDHIKRISSEVHNSIIAAGDGGNHVVRDQEAEAICATIIRRELIAAREAAEREALQELHPLAENSVTHQSLSALMGRLDPPIDLAEHPLRPEAAELLQQMLAEELSNPDLPAERLRDATEQRRLADAEAALFIEIRAKARRGIERLEFLDEAEKKALLAQVTRGNIAAELAAPLARAYRSVKADLADLAGPLSHQEAEHAIAAIGDAIARAFRRATAAGIRIEVGNPQAYLDAWRVLLAPGGADQAAAIGRQLANHQGSLRSIGEAAAWHASTFESRPDESLDYSGVRFLPQGVSIDRPTDSRCLATHCASLMRSLQTVAHEMTVSGTDASNALKIDSTPSDRTIAALRNLGIPCPGPDGLGRSNDKVPLSLPQLHAIREELDIHLASASRELHPSGLTTVSMDFLRAGDRAPLEKQDRLRPAILIDGQRVNGNAEQVAAELRRLCTDDQGRVNQRLLTNISLVLNLAPIDCVDRVCMDPARPHLSIMQGTPTGVFLGHTYNLWADRNKRLHLEVSTSIKPLFFHRADENAVVHAPDRQHAAAPQNDRIWMSDASEFQTNVRMTFQPRTCKPQLDEDGVAIRYALHPGRPAGHWFLQYPVLPADAASNRTPSPDYAEVRY